MEDTFLISVPRALTYLYREGKTGHWIDVRTTAEAILALLASGEGIQSLHLQYASDFLVGKFRREKEGGSWGSELWDTALAVRALHHLPTKSPDLIENAFRWIWTTQLADGSFDGEPWDSLFVCLAAVETGRADRILKTAEWLALQQTKQGVLISSHYTGLFCHVLGRALDHDLPSSLRHKLQEVAIRSLHFLWDEYDATTLWGATSWTNAYIIRGILALRHPQILARYDDILVWYANRQSENGAWDDVVRTAIVLQSLLELRLAYEIDRCTRKPLQALTLEFLSRSTQVELCKAIQLNTIKEPVVRAPKLIDRDESGNRVITLTREREMYLAIVAFMLSLLWSVVRNWDLIRPFLFP